MGSLIDSATLERAEQDAAEIGVGAHAVLLASGWVSQTDYTAALARSLGAAMAGDDLLVDAEGLENNGPVGEDGLPAMVGSQPCRVVCATDVEPGIVRVRVASLQSRGWHVVLASQAAIDAAVEVHISGEGVDRAVHEFLRQRPELSAGTRTRTWQIVAVAIAIGAAIGGLFVLPAATLAALTGLIALPFLCVTLLRLVALHQVVSPSAVARRARRHLPRIPDHSLPVYTIMVPLLREGNVLPDLVRSLRALDYPAAKLDVMLVLEATDAETCAALLMLDLPGNFRAVVVPSRSPQTKPKALNYALQFARGDFVVVYDAEDRPEPDQLRRSLEIFRINKPDLACVQAQLNIYNHNESWLARQFTIEYSALFDAVLPALERLGLPVPLGGTSNHFPREVLIQAGAWDPFNVTEDADLGIRLARQNLRTAVLASTTWEEAPADLATWLKQRTRWLKGWMQTYLVHTRRPAKLKAELGLRGAIGFHALMGGLILSALVHPLFYALLGYYALVGELFAATETTFGAVFWAIAWINLGVGYAISILVGVLSVWRRRRLRLALSALLMPLYWLLISLAAYRALYQLARDPYLWEKTEHGVGRAR